MNYSLELTAKSPIEKIFTQESGKQNRSEIKFKKNKIIINANDSVALKAAVNNIIKALTIYEKSEKLIKND